MANDRERTIAVWSAEAALTFSDYFNGAWDGRRESLPEALKKAAGLLNEHELRLHVDDDGARPIVAKAIIAAREGREG